MHLMTWGIISRNYEMKRKMATTGILAEYQSL